MKIITEIKVLETNRDYCEIARTSHGPQLFMNVGADVVSTGIVRELIKGRRFIDPARGVDVVLGVSQEVGDMLGLQYEAFENMQYSVYSLQKSNNVLTDKLQNISELGFWGRLKCLFRGVNIN